MATEETYPDMKEYGEFERPAGTGQPQPKKKASHVEVKNQIQVW